MNTAALTPELMRAPWRGPRPDGTAGAQIMRDPAAADESVLGFPVRWMPDGAPLVMLGDAPAVLDQPLANETGWQSVELPPLSAGATGYVLLTTMGWRPYHGTPYSGSLDTPLLARALQTLRTPELVPDAQPPRTSTTPRHSAQALQALIDAVYELSPQVLLRAYLPTKPAAAAAALRPGTDTAPTGSPPLRFAFASCQYPAGLFDTRPAEAALQRLASRCDDSPQEAPQSVLFLGDQIYADATYGLLDATRSDDRFNAAHAQWLGMKPLRRIMAKVPVHCMLDDHEIEDNWEPPGPDTLAEGLRSFLAHQRPGTAAQGPPLWRTVPLGQGHEVFMLDTRTERDPRPWTPGLRPTHLMGPAQREELSRWLHETTSPIRWIASPVWLLPRPVGRPAEDGTPSALDPVLCDAWPGFPDSLDWLLGRIAQEQIQNIVMLCGDAHLAGHTVLTLSTGGTSVPTRVDLLHCPALYAPFPFANARPHQFLTEDTLHGSTAEGTWRCEVKSTLWENGDGFVELRCLDHAQGPRITATFDTATMPCTVRIP